MKKNVLEKFSIKNMCLAITFFIFFGLFVSENIFGYKTFKDKYINAKLVKDNGVYTLITMQIYEYAEKDFGFIENCVIEGIDEGNNSYKIMEIKVPEQKKNNSTEFVMKNKIPNDKILFMGFDTKYDHELWPEHKKASMYATVPTVNHFAVAAFLWDHSKAHPKLKYISVKGTWKNRSTEKDHFSLKFLIKNPKKIHSDDQKVNTDTTEINGVNPVEVHCESDAIVVKGAKSGEIIKIFDEFGTEIKSITSNSDVVQVKVPSKKFYIVHVGESKQKVYLP